MKIPQFALLSPYPFYIKGLGYLKSPKLKDICPCNPEKFENWLNYSFGVQVVFATDDEIKGFIVKCGYEQEYAGLTQEQLRQMSKYQTIIYSPKIRELYASALSLFFVGKVEFYAPESCFLVFDNDDTEKCDPIGAFNEESLPFVESLVVQLVHSTKRDDSKEKNFASARAKELYLKRQKFENLSKTIDSKKYELGNVISKLCVQGAGYNLLNVFELTVYQLYDQFGAYNQNRVSKISERAYSTWGGDDFDFEAWLKT